MQQILPQSNESFAVDWGNSTKPSTCQLPLLVFCWISDSPLKGPASDALFVQAEGDHGGGREIFGSEKENGNGVMVIFEPVTYRHY